MALNGFDQEHYSNQVITAVVGDNGISKLISNQFSPAENGKIVIPVLSAGSAHTGGDNTFDAEVDAFVEIDTKNSASKPTAVKFIDEESTTLDMLALKAQQDGKACVAEVNAKVLRGILGAAPAGNRLKLDALDSTASKELTYAAMTTLVELFDTAAIPLDERLLVISPRFKANLLNIKDGNGNLIFISADKMGEAAGKKGIIGEALGFKVHMAFDFPQLNKTTGNVVEPATVDERFAMAAMDMYAYAVAMDDRISVKDDEDLVKEQHELLSRVKYGHKETLPNQIWTIRQVLK